MRDREGGKSHCYIKGGSSISANLRGLLSPPNSSGKQSGASVCKTGDRLRSSMEELVALYFPPQPVHSACFVYCYELHCSFAIFTLIQFNNSSSVRGINSSCHQYRLLLHVLQ